MSKLTSEDALRARLKDPRGHRGTITDHGGKLCLVFGAIGEHPRMSILVQGDQLEFIQTEGAEKAEGASSEKIAGASETTTRASAKK